jgi:hypothetical protein
VISTSIKLEGWDKLANAARVLGAQCIAINTRKVLKKVGDELAADLRGSLYGQVRRRTGEAGASIGAVDITEESGEPTIRIGPRTNKKYPHGHVPGFFERGTKSIAPRKWFAPMWAAAQARILERLKEHYRRELNRVGRAIGMKVT